MARHGGTNLKWETREIVRYLQSNWPDALIASTLGCTTSAIIGVRSRLRQGMYKNLEDLPRAEIMRSPPSPAMVRLAEFDPVVRRAMEQKNGEGT